MKKQVRPVTEGAMMLAIVGVLLYLNRMTGSLLMSFLVFALPLPSIFYIAKYGFKQGLLLGVSILLFPIIIGDFIALFYVATAVIVGTAYGYGVYKNKDNGWLILVSTFFTAISSLIEVYLLAQFLGEDFIGEMRIAMQTLIDGLVANGATNVPSNIMVLVMSMIPMMLIAISLAQAFVTHLFAIILLKRLKIQTRSMKPLSEWVIPKWIAFVAALGIFANLGLAYAPNETVQIILTNIYTFSTLVFCVDAYIFIALYARLSGRRFLVLVGLLVFLLQPFGIVIGLFDCFTDLRKRVLYNYAKPVR